MHLSSEAHELKKSMETAENQAKAVKELQLKYATDALNTDTDAIVRDIQQKMQAFDDLEMRMKNLTEKSRELTKLQKEENNKKIAETAKRFMVRRQS